jgi:hypothetical protein
MNQINSYPSIYAIGHKAIAAIFDTPVTIEEKIDGSQFSMARFDGELHCRSKGKAIIPDAPEKMFVKAIEVAATRPLRDGWIYRCEYLQSAKHNTLNYGRIPDNHLIVFDVCTGVESYLSHAEKAAEASRIGLEAVPLLHEGKVESMSEMVAFLERESILGGCKIEGFVAKNYNLFTVDKKIAIGKFVSEAFKEKHGVEWKKSNPGRYEVVQSLVFQLKTEARWRKAVQHLREAGQLTESPKDIGPLLKEIQSDVQREESAFIQEQLWKHFWPEISRGIIAGFPEHYKRTLAEGAFQTP